MGDVKVAGGNNGNAYIPLREVADIKLETGASYIYRDAMQRLIPIKFSVRGRDLGGAVAEARERIKRNVKLPTGYRVNRRANSRICSAPRSGSKLSCRSVWR